MIILKINVEQGDIIDVSKRGWRDITRRGYDATGRHWHSTILPLHFQPDARTRYRHDRRSHKWTERKARLAATGKAKLGGAVDNVFTGLLMDLVTNHWMMRAYPTRATVRMVGPRYVTMRVWKSHQPDKARELTTITNDERRELASILKKTIVAGLNAYRQKHQKKSST